jgi:predicted ATPase
VSVGEGFVGRRAELNELRSVIEDGVKGRGSLAIVAGEPGWQFDRIDSGSTTIVTQ